VEFDAEGGGEVALEGGGVERLAAEIALHGAEGVGAWGVDALNKGGPVALAGVEDGFRGDAIDGDDVVAVDDEGGEGVGGLRMGAGGAGFDSGLGAGGLGGGGDEEDGKLQVGGALESVLPFFGRGERGQIEGLQGEGDHEGGVLLLFLEESDADCIFDLFDDGDGGTDGTESGVDPVGGSDAVGAAEVDCDADGGCFAAEGGSEEAEGWLCLMSSRECWSMRRQRSMAV
jgi:hypothetical protein